MKNAIRIISLLFTGIFFVAGAESGNLYKCKSPDGGIEFSNVACSDETADRKTVMGLQNRQPWERDTSPSIVERAERFSQQRQRWVDSHRTPQSNGATTSRSLTFGQKQALRNAEVGRPRYDKRLTASENAAAQNAHNARARTIIGKSGLNPNNYVKDQKLPDKVIIHQTPSAPTYVPSTGKWCQQQGSIINCW